MTKTTRIATALFLASCGAAANAATISILRAPSAIGPNLTLTSTASQISLADFHDQHSETSWSTASAVDSADGGVNVTYSYGPYGAYDPYSAFGDLAFEILSDDGSTTPESIVVDVYGQSLYRHQVHLGCCFPVAPQVSIEGAGIPLTHYSPPLDGTLDVLDGSLTLLTNTRYNIFYSNTQYVEGVPQPGYMPTYFASRAEYDAWTAINGTSGTISVDSFGFMNWNLMLRPHTVPEPGTLALLGAGLLVLGLARRRRKDQA